MSDTRKTSALDRGTNDAPELMEVSEAAEVALEARASGDEVVAAGERLTAAAKAALDAGYGLALVAEAEAAGQAAARDRIRKDLLRRVERSAKRMREVTAEHEALVAQADELGLAAREIAERAGVAHGTIAAIVRRHGARLNGGASSSPVATANSAEAVTATASDLSRPTLDPAAHDGEAPPVDGRHDEGPAPRGRRADQGLLDRG